LAVILLEIRTAWKEDLKATTAELVYGEPLRLPGQSLEDRPGKPAENMVGRLRKIIEKLGLRMRRHGEKTIFVFKDMSTAPKVFVRQDALAGTFQLL